MQVITGIIGFICASHHMIYELSQANVSYLAKDLSFCLMSSFKLCFMMFPYLVVTRNVFS